MDQLAPSDEVKLHKRAVFDADIRQILGYLFSLPVDCMHFETGNVIEEKSDKFYGPTPFLDNFDGVPCSVPVVDCVDVNGQPIFAGSCTDVMISSEVLLPQRELPQLAKVIRQSVDKNGKVIGNHKKKSFLNNLVYDVEFLDCAVKKYAARFIAENVLSQCDPDAFYTNAMYVVLDHNHAGTAVPMSDKYFMKK